MPRSTLNYVVDAATLLVLLCMVATGLILEFVLPPGSGGVRHAPDTLWTLARHDWGQVHFYAAVAMACLIVVHLALHWRWAFATTARLVLRRSYNDSTPAWKRNAIGAGLFGMVVAAFALFVGAARLSVVGPYDDESEVRTDAKVEYSVHQ
jgi:hypothetical protein